MGKWTEPNETRHACEVENRYHKAQKHLEQENNLVRQEEMLESQIKEDSDRMDEIEEEYKGLQNRVEENNKELDEVRNTKKKRMKGMKRYEQKKKRLQCNIIK